MRLQQPEMAGRQMDGQQIGVYVSAPWLKFQAYSDNISPSNSFMDGDVHFFFFLVAKTTFSGTKLWCISRPFWLTLYKVLGGKCLRIGSWLLMLSFQDEVFCFHFETDGTSPHAVICSTNFCKISSQLIDCAPRPAAFSRSKAKLELAFAGEKMWEGQHVSFHHAVFCCFPLMSCRTADSDGFHGSPHFVRSKEPRRPNNVMNFPTWQKPVPYVDATGLKLNSTVVPLLLKHN